MSFYSELDTIINKILEVMYEDQSLMRYLAYDSLDPLKVDVSQPDIVGSDMVFDRLFPIPKSSDSLTTEGSVISAYLGSSRLWNDNLGYRKDTFYIDIIVNLDSWRLDDGLRPYKMMELIDKKFNNQNIDNEFLQKILSTGVMSIAYANDYYGYRLSYQISNNSNVDCG